MKFSNAFAMGFTFVFSSGILLPLRAADPPSDNERPQNLEKAVRQLQQRSAELEKEVPPGRFFSNHVYLSARWMCDGLAH
jgi:hypothetical protein